MIKKILPISVFVLVLIIILLIGIQKMLSDRKTDPSSLTPTLFQGKQGTVYNPQTRKAIKPSVKQLTPEEVRKKLPIVSPEFTVDYSSRMQKYVVSLKPDENNDSDVSQGAYDQWFEQNQSYASVLTPEQLIIAEQTVDELHDALDYAEEHKLTPEQEFKKNNDAILNIINTLFSSFPDITSSPTDYPLPTIIPSEVPRPVPSERPVQTNSGSNQYTYYPQCGGPYDKGPLPKGCTICNAGCGPTTAAMILSTYVDSTLTPPKVIASMSKAGVSIGCQGSGVYELYKYMSKVNGIKVSSLMSFGEAPAREVADDFRNYIKAGWTLFVLTKHVTWGHFFWVTDVSPDGKILAFDPAYGSRRSRPLNENQYSPFPYYKFAFAVKKN